MIDNSLICPGNGNENRCRACSEKNGIGMRDTQDPSKSSNEVSEGKKITRDIDVSTPSKHLNENVDREVCHGKDNSKEAEGKDKSRSKSGHARTHAIVINLDDKSRFSEEVTV